MKVIVHLTMDGTKETRLEGDAKIFDSRLKPWLGDIGFWLSDWRYAGHSGQNHKGRVFIPWGSALYIKEIGKD